MTGSAFLELAIGLIFVYVLISLMCSGLSEIIGKVFKLRANTLKQGIQHLINDETIRKEFYNHPLIKSLSKDPSDGEKSDLTYIPSSNFALALIGNLTSAAESEGPAEDPSSTADSPVDDAIKQLQKGINGLPENSELRKSLSTFLVTADRKIDSVQQNVEDWFNSVMSQASGWYKKKTQWILFAMALVVSVAFNADTIDLATSLWQNPTLRQSVAEAASAYVDQTEGMDQPQSIEAVQQYIRELKELEALKLPLGWSAETTPDTFGAWLLKLVGLLFTTFAAAQGAPFWFDLLRKLVSRRS